jgi:peptidoglycan-N-acetylglucosamine deacetylase
MPFNITLTFDNGPEPDVTPYVLDVLRQSEIRATFFVLGTKLAAKGGRTLAERAVAEGHWIGNHTYSHSVPLGEADDAGVLDAEIGRTQDLIGDLAHPDRFFRPFGRGGSIGPHLLSRDAIDYLQRGKYTCVLWNAIPRDWNDADGWVARALDQARAQPHSLMVLHDLPSGAMKNLKRFIDEARALGATFVQVFPEDCVLIRAGVPTVSLDPYVSAVSA